MQEQQLKDENKAKARARYKVDPEKKASVRDSYKACLEKKVSPSHKSTRGWQHMHLLQQAITY